MAVKIEWPIYQVPEQSPFFYTCWLLLLASWHTWPCLLGTLKSVSPLHHTCVQGRQCPVPLKGEIPPTSMSFFIPLSVSPSFPFPLFLPFPQYNSSCVFYLHGVSVSHLLWDTLDPLRSLLCSIMSLLPCDSADSPGIPPCPLAAWGVLGPWNLHQPLSLFWPKDCWTPPTNILAKTDEPPSEDSSVDHVFCLQVLLERPRIGQPRVSLTQSLSDLCSLWWCKIACAHPLSKAPGPSSDNPRPACATVHADLPGH